MTDIVERLRTAYVGHWEIRREAADEIERLETELKLFKNNWLAEVEHNRSIRAATIEECAKPLKQIRQVCADNASDGCDHKMALDFVHQIAIRALKEQS